ncbi:MAG: hypothetical protein ACRDJL_02230 [Actinomycetota bacterium]
MRFGLVRMLLLFVFAGCADPASSEFPEGEGRPVAAPFVEIVCTRDGGTRLWTPVVEVQPDGVHVDVDNRAGEPAGFYGLGTLDVGEGRHKVVISEPPGGMRVACDPHSRHESDKKPVRYDLELVDPQNHWITTELECDPGTMIQSTISDFEELGEGLAEDPVALVEESVQGLRADDVVELAGYPKADTPSVRIVRAGQVIGVFGFLEADDEGLELETSNLCGSEGLRY